MRLQRPHKLLLHKYYIDEIYDALFVHRVKDLGSALAAFDMGVVDGGVNGVGWLTRMSGELSRLWDTWIIDGLVNVLAFVVKTPELAGAHRADGLGAKLCLVHHRGRYGFHGLLFCFTDRSCSRGSASRSTTP